MQFKTFIENFSSMDVQISSSVRYSIRSEIEKNRQLFHGKFVNPEDSGGLKKFFYNIGFILLNALYNPTDIDTKDINIRSTNPANRFLVDLIKNAVRTELRFSHFGDKINRIRWNMLKDGTCVIKLTKDGFDLVDLLNLVVLPHLHNWSGQIIAERIDIPVSDLESKLGKNFKKEKPALLAVKERLENEGVFYATIYEYWTTKNGEPTCEVWLDRSALEPDENNDPDTWTPFIQIDEYSSPFINKENKKIHPYKKVDFVTVEGRAIGFGVFELVRNLQEHFNELWNIKRKKDRQDLAGTYIFKKGVSGTSLTQEFISERELGAVIELNQDEDLQRLIADRWTSDIIASADKLFEYARMIVGANAIGVGDSLPASMPATTSAIMAKQSKTTYDVIIEQLGFFLSDLFEDYYLKLIIDNLDRKEWALITGDPNELQELDRYFATQLVYRKLEQLKGSPELYALLGNDPFREREQELIDQLVQEQLSELKKQGKSRYVQVKKKILRDLNFLCEVYISNDTFDRNVQIQNILSIASNPLFTGSRQKLFNTVLDLMDLGGKDFEKSPEETKQEINASQTLQPQTSQTGEIPAPNPANAATTTGGVSQAT